MMSVPFCWANLVSPGAVSHEYGFPRGRPWAAHLVRVESENRMKTVKECTESTTTGSGVQIEERRER
jgi:hypothetical protein